MNKTLASRIAAPFWWLTGKLFGYHARTAELSELARLRVAVADLERQLQDERMKVLWATQDAREDLAVRFNQPGLFQQNFERAMQQQLGMNALERQLSYGASLQQCRRSNFLGLGGLGL